MSSRGRTFKIFQSLSMFALGLSVVLTQLPTVAGAESYGSAEPGNPAASGKIKAKSKETWDDMKARWSKQKDRWADCQRQEKLEKRSRAATREFLDNCMKQ